MVAPLTAQTDYNTFIRQTQQTTSVVWDMPLAATTGDSLAPMSLESGGALFQLYTVKNTGAVSYLLDQKVVGAYLPKATVKIVTEDPYAKFPRTQVGRPFTVQITVDGLLNTATAPDAAKKVLVQRFATRYPTTNYSMTVAQATTGTPLSTSYIAVNGLTSTTYPSTGIVPAAGQDAMKVAGEEHFLVHALADGTITQTQIASGFVQILPRTTGAILGVTSGQKIGTNAPVITLDLKDLYPRSDTWLQVYSGAYIEGKEGDKVQSGTRILDQDKPETMSLTVSDWAKTIKEDGPYVLELLTSTPFGIRSLGAVPVIIDRTIKVQSTLVDMN